jgi:hypothetical protein
MGEWQAPEERTVVWITEVLILRMKVLDRALLRCLVSLPMRIKERGGGRRSVIASSSDSSGRAVSPRILCRLASP